MYTLYIGNKNYSSWSLRPWALLTALDIPFEEILVPFDDGGSWQKFRSFSPTGLVPCLHDNDVVVWESLSIVEYIAEAHPQTWPTDPVVRAWARSATAEMHAGFSHLRNDCAMTVGLRIKLHHQSAGLGEDLRRLGELWQEGLRKFGGPFLAGETFTKFGGPFLAGETFTAADAFYAPVVFRIQTYGLELPAAAQRYVQHMLAQPVMKTWTDAALQESYREPSHEEEIAACGQWLQDLRAPLQEKS